MGRKRNGEPNVPELRILDAYWPDHCRHTTFETELTSIDIDDFEEARDIREALDQWDASRAAAEP